MELSDQSPGEVVADAVAITPPLSLADRFDWSPTLPSAGDYAVYAKWQAGADRAADATYEVTHSGGVDQVTVDQTHNGGEWRYLGTWNFDPSQSPTVSLLASLGGTVDADAVRFVSGDAIGGTIEYSHTDQIGAIQKLTDASGALVWDRTARPFGETVSISAASGVAQQLRFPGQYADETGLSYNYFRDYDPTLGRYSQSDPIGLAGGINTYAYASADPIRGYDILGLQPNEVCPRPNVDCAELEQDMYKLAAAIDRRIMDLRVDRKNLYCLRYNTPIDSWRGHQFAISYRQRDLRGLILTAQAAGCHVSNRAGRANSDRGMSGFSA